MVLHHLPTCIPWWILIHPAVILLSANTLSKASPLPISIELDHMSMPSTKILDLKGPLSCYGNLTAHESEDYIPSVSCDSRTFCQGTTSCNDTLICSRDWIDLNGTLACDGELFCNGTLSCSRNSAHPACLPGLNKLPTPALSIIIMLLVVVSGGLNGLKSAFMSLDPIDLRAIMDTGTMREKELVGRIHEARQHSEFTTLFLCAMTLTTVMINHSLPLMAACLLNNNLWGFLLSSALVIIFGEILPLMVFPRLPLLILGNMMWAIYTASCILCIPACILSYIYETTAAPGPVQHQVDLRAVREENDSEISIDATRLIRGIVDMEKRVARDIMKPLSEVKMKSVDSRMTFHSWTEISDWGYSRVPIYMSLDHNKGNNSIYSDFNIKVMGFLHVFDLLLVVLDQVTTLKGLPVHKMPIVSEDYPLWDLLHLFREGASHMAIVERDLEEIERFDPLLESRPSQSFWGIAKGKCQNILRRIFPCNSKATEVKRTSLHHGPKYWTDEDDYLSSRGYTTGIVTLEDVLETLMQSRILDEKDVSLGRCIMDGTGSTRSSSKIATSPEQISTLDTCESLVTNETGRNIPHVDPGKCHMHLSPVRKVGSSQRKAFLLHNNQTLSSLSKHSKDYDGKRRVSFPRDAYRGDVVPNIERNIETSDRRNFRSKTFPRNMEYTKVDMGPLLLGQPIDLWGFVCDEETDLKIVPGPELDTHGHRSPVNENSFDSIES